MTTLEQAARQALEALIWTTGSTDFGKFGHAHQGALKLLFPAINALRQALEQAAQQVPVGTEQTDDLVSSHEIRARLRQAPKQLKQEPVGEVNRHGLDSLGRKWHGIHWYDANVDVPHGTKLYTEPPKREWVGLTDEQVEDLYFDNFSMSELKGYARAIEAKLKELNT